MRRALWLSGGKDSVACLLLCREELGDIEVLWANTGKYMPEHLEWIWRLREMCPRFHEVVVDRDEQNARCGLPSDLVPVRATVEAMQQGAQRRPLVQSFTRCCFDNIAWPLWSKTKELGCDVVIRGQKDADEMRSPFRDGEIADGITLRHPVESWTDEQVRDFVEAHIDVPEFYSLAHTSFDCFDCTAYSAHSKDREHYLRRKHPKEHAILARRMADLKAAIDLEYREISEILEA